MGEMRIAGVLTKPFAMQMISIQMVFCLRAVSGHSFLPRLLSHCSSEVT